MCSAGIFHTVQQMFAYAKVVEWRWRWWWWWWWRRVPRVKLKCDSMVYMVFTRLLYTRATTKKATQKHASHSIRHRFVLPVWSTPSIGNISTSQHIIKSAQHIDIIMRSSVDAAHQNNGGVILLKCKYLISYLYMPPEKRMQLLEWGPSPRLPLSVHSCAAYSYYIRERFSMKCSRACLLTF